MMRVCFDWLRISSYDDCCILVVFAQSTCNSSKYTWNGVCISPKLFPYGLHLSSPPVCFNIFGSMLGNKLKIRNAFYAAQNRILHSTLNAMPLSLPQRQRFRILVEKNSRMCSTTCVLRAIRRFKSFTRRRNFEWINLANGLQYPCVYTLIWPARRID